MSALNERIRQRREKLGMSQAELAELLGYSDRSTIAKIEKGTNDITQSKIEAFAKVLGTTPAYLMGWENETGQDLGLTAIDVSQWLNAPPEMVDAVMDGMGWPDPTNPEMLSKISAEVERQRTLDQLADDFVKTINDISEDLTLEDKRMLLDMAKHLRNTHRESGAVITSKGPYYLYNYADSPSEAEDTTRESIPAPQESKEISPKDEA